MNKKILVVDDEVELVNSVKVLLQADDRDILTSFDGTTAMEIIRNENIDCVVSDIYMPNMDGMMLIKEIRVINNTVPVIFFTGFGNPKLLKEALGFGAYDFIEKPNLDDLCKAVDTCLVGSDDKQKGDAVTELDEILDKDD